MIVDLDSQHYTAFPNKYYLLINIMLPSGWFCDSLVESDIWILILMLITHLDATRQMLVDINNQWTYDLLPYLRNLVCGRIISSNGTGLLTYLLVGN